MHRACIARFSRSAALHLTNERRVRIRRCYMGWVKVQKKKIVHDPLALFCKSAREGNQHHARRFSCGEKSVGSRWPLVPRISIWNSAASWYNVEPQAHLLIQPKYHASEDDKCESIIMNRGFCTKFRAFILLCPRHGECQAYLHDGVALTICQERR